MHFLQTLESGTAGWTAIVFLCSFVVTSPLVALTIKVCRRHGWVATPRADRWHRNTPAFFGGVPVFIGFLVATMAFVPWSNHLLWRLIGTSSLMFVLGLVDDVHRLAPSHKLVIQTIISALLVLSGAVYPLRASTTINIAISIVWLVGITNAFNLLDNMDGLSAGVALISAGYLLAFYISSGYREQALIVAVAAGSAAGFLLFNFNPALIFMGDSGSLFLGFLLGSTSLLEVTHVSGVPAFVFAPITVLAIPIFDTVFVSVTRRLRGQAISQGGTDHSSHRLVRMGLQEKRAVLLLYVLSALSGAVALFAHSLSASSAPGLIGLWFFFLLLFGIHLFHDEGSEYGHAPRGSGSVLNRLLRRDTLAFVLDPLAMLLSYYLAYLIRFQGHIPDADKVVLLRSLPFVIGAKLLSLWLCRAFRHSWWRGSINDIYRVGAALLIGEAIAILTLTVLYRFVDFSRQVFALDAMLTLLLLLAVRRSSGVFRDTISNWSKYQHTQHRVFVLGTSQKAELALRFLREQRIECAGFIDANGGSDVRRYVFGRPVLGCLHDLEDLARKHGISELVVPENEQMPIPLADLHAFCRRRALRIRNLGLYEEVVTDQGAAVELHVNKVANA